MGLWEHALQLIFCGHHITAIWSNLLSFYLNRDLGKASGLPHHLLIGLRSHVLFLFPLPPDPLHTLFSAPLPPIQLTFMGSVWGSLALMSGFVQPVEAREQEWEGSTRSSPPCSLLAVLTLGPDMVSSLHSCCWSATVVFHWWIWDVIRVFQIHSVCVYVFSICFSYKQLRVCFYCFSNELSHWRAEFYSFLVPKNSTSYSSYRTFS